MINLDSIEVHSRTLPATFDTKAAADKAVRDLAWAGTSREHISLIGSGTTSAKTTGGEKGFLDSSMDFFMPEEDRAYANGLRRGGHLVSVRSDEAKYTKVMDILDTDGAIDLDACEASWRSEGWTGYQVGATGLAAAGAGRTAYGTSSTGGIGAATRTATTGAASGARKLAAGEEEVIPVYEEQLRIGKRDVSHGRVRLRSYVVETPVTERVALHSEHVEIERHPVGRPVSATDAAFRDRTIEAEEYAEEAVVQKEVRLKEEIGLRKVVEERTQTMSDKVRHTEIEIEDERGTVKRDATSTVGAIPKPRNPKI